MCGRFTLTIPDYDSLARALQVAPDPAGAELYRPRYNVAPTDSHWILRVKEGRRELLPAKWGLVNSWAKDASGAARQINARVETARTRPAFREAFERRRCIVPADGFLEWSGDKKARRPIWYHAAEGGLLRFAGLYESWRDPRSGAWQRTFSILTTSANDVVAPVHDRMPAILRLEDEEAWLGPVGDDAGALLELQQRLEPAPHDAIVGTRVSPRVNSVKNDDPSCLAPEP